MTPEREAEIREWIAEEPHRVFYGSHWLRASDLLAEIDRLWKIRINSQATYDLVLEKYDSLKAAAEPFITHSAKLVQAAAGKAYVTIEVPMDDILSLRKELRGS